MRLSDFAYLLLREGRAMAPNGAEYIEGRVDVPLNLPCMIRRDARFGRQVVFTAATVIELRRRAILDGARELTFEDLAPWMRKLITHDESAGRIAWEHTRSVRP
jgi:hypothetical protein